MKNRFLTLFEKCSDELKELAFTHSSFANEKKIESNERVEFLGDSVLSTIVSDYLYKHYHQTEGKMSKIRASFVCTENLSKLAKSLKIEDRIHFGKSFKGNDISDAILADTIESMIGVMYLSFGMPSIASAVIDALEIKENLNKDLFGAYSYAYITRTLKLFETLGLVTCLDNEQNYTNYYDMFRPYHPLIDDFKTEDE